LLLSEDIFGLYFQSKDNGFKIFNISLW
jgi:hypothetical protein